tara:strand:- start:1 stop:1041 length:1041 start_codon:yes stop_codon:yes gene_type:complete
MKEIRDIINHLSAYKTLSRVEAQQILSDIAEGKYSETEMAAFLTIYLMRNVTVDELIGFRDALLEHCQNVDLGTDTLIDLCGTGGDSKDTFNISTLASFVAAGAGAKVAKHGNFGVSSNCGSSNVLEFFGCEFTNDEKTLKTQLKESGICFLHAPLFNPAMKNIAPVRKKLKVKTFFNMLGPMVNPARPQKQMVGVFSLELARLYNYIYQKGNTDFVIIHSLDGYDEISLTGDFKCIDRSGEHLYSPKDIGYSCVDPNLIIGGKDVPSSALIFKQILEGKGSAVQNAVVISNGAFALQAYFECSLQEAHARAEESLMSGHAKTAFNSLIELSKLSHGKHIESNSIA